MTTAAAVPDTLVTETTPRVATATIRGMSPYCQGRPFSTDDKEPQEPHAEYELKSWRRRQHVNKDGIVVIPALALKNCIAEAAKFLSMQVPGKGKATFTKHFEAGVMVEDDAPLGIKGDDVEPYDMFVPASGRRGDGARVHKFFPVIDEWEAEVAFIVLDGTITKEVFRRHLIDAGRFIGLGSFRPRNNGTFGRFEVVKFEWGDL